MLWIVTPHSSVSVKSSFCFMLKCTPCFFSPYLGPIILKSSQKLSLLKMFCRCISSLWWKRLKWYHEEQHLTFFLKGSRYNPSVHTEIWLLKSNIVNKFYGNEQGKTKFSQNLTGPVTVKKSSPKMWSIKSEIHETDGLLYTLSEPQHAKTIWKRWRYTKTWERHIYTILKETAKG